MLLQGQLAGIRTPAGWRVFDPGPTLLDRLRQQSMALEDTALLRGCEVAQLLRVSTRWVRKMAEAGKLPFRSRHGRRVYALADVLSVRDRPHEKRQPGSYVRPSVVAWARKQMAEVAHQ